jgi:hypothetical protein
MTALPSCVPAACGHRRRARRRGCLSMCFSRAWRDAVAGVTGRRARGGEWGRDVPAGAR